MTGAAHKNKTIASGKKEFLNMRFDCKALPEKEDKDYFYFEGYLSTYGNVDLGGDVIEAGCFDESIKEFRPELRWQHQRKGVIGVFEEIRSDLKGLWVQGKMPKDDSLVSGRVIPQMKVGSVRSMSIGFHATESEWDDDGVRHIKKGTLIEGSLVGMPMNPEAQIVNMKTFNIEDVEEIKTKREFEKMLRDSGAFSKKAVVYLASKFQEEQSESDTDFEMGGAFKSLTNELKELQNV